MMFIKTNQTPLGHAQTKASRRSFSGSFSCSILGLFLGLSLLSTGCELGDEVSSPEDGISADQTEPSTTGALILEPRLRLTGLTDVDRSVRLTELHVNADLFLLPEDGEGAGDSIPTLFQYIDGQSRTVLLSRSLRLPSPGRYQVLVRVRPTNDQPALVMRGEMKADGVSGDRRKERSDEPAPSPALDPVSPADEPAPSPAFPQGDEPAPSPAMPEGDEPAPSPAMPEGDEPAPSPAMPEGDEPAPSPAKPESDEPAPSPAWPSPEHADEPAPSPAYNGDLPSAEGDDRSDEPAPSPARQKNELDPFNVSDDAGTLFARSNDAYEFYAGVVVIAADDTELVVTWDARQWLRSVLSDTLGLDSAPSPNGSPERAFRNVADQFRIEAY